MRIIKQLSHLCFFLLAVTLLQACAPNTLTSSWVDQSFKGPLKGKILVVGVFKDPTAHKIFEDSFVNSLVKSGADAVPSYSYSQGIERHSKGWLDEVRKRSGANFILLAHLSHEQKETENFLSHGVILGGATYGDDTDGYHSYIVERTLTPGYFETKTTDFIDVSIFSSQTNKIIWSAHSKSLNLNHLLRTDDEQLENLYIREMKRDHLL